VEQLTDRVILNHPKGATVEILLYGATVISWKSPGAAGGEPLERLFVSSKAVLDGSKPVRGGIPIVFPVFGAPALPQFLKLKQHGYARCSTWSFASVLNDDNSNISVRFSLDSTPEVKASFDFPVSLEYIVTLSERELGTKISVTNNSDKDELRFQALFHNYIRAPANDVKISPLTGKNYFDKTAATAEAKATPILEQRNEVDVRKLTDSVYVDGGQVYEVSWPQGGIQIKTEGLKDVVIWNPQEVAGKAIGDMEYGGWEKYVCVEPGHVQGYVTLPVGETWIGQQILGNA